MTIERIEITAFGKLENFTLTLSEGINILEGENESGKSTLAAFIKFMFYGAPAKERAAIIGWKSGGAAGTMTVSTGTHRYRIERALIASGGEKVSYRETVQLVDLANNMPCHKGECPGELFFGVDAEMFAATAFVSQLGGTDVGGTKIVEGIENLLFSADETVNTQRALSKIDAARVMLLHKNERGGILSELEAECAQLEKKLASALETSHDILAKEAQLADVRKNETAAGGKAELLEAKIRQFEARTITKLFDRMHALEARVDELRTAIDASGAPDPDEVNRMRTTAERITALRRELDETTAKLGTSDEPTRSDTLEQYLANGGREGVETTLAELHAGAKVHTAVGIVLAVFAAAGLGIGLLPLISGGAPILWAILVGAVFAALSVTLFSSGASRRKKAATLASEFDIERLERELEAFNAAVDAAKLASIACDALQKQLDTALAEAEAAFPDTPADKLDEALATLNEKCHAVEGLKTEYDKFSALLNGMRDQLASYNETDLKAAVDLSVDIRDVDAENLPAIRREATFAAKSAASLAQHAAELEKALAGIYPAAENPAKLSDRLEAVKSERTKLTKKLNAYKLAYDKLTEASANLRESVSPRLAAFAAELMKAVTGGKYDSLGVGGTLELSADTGSGTRSVSLLSAGTQDAAYISLRLALTNLLYRKCTPPTIYDESFSRLDDTRLSKLLKIIATQEQSILLTSNGRDAELMQSVGEFNLIRL